MAKPYAVDSVPSATKATTRKLYVLTMCLFENMVASLTISKHRMKNSYFDKQMQQPRIHVERKGKSCSMQHERST